MWTPCSRILRFSRARRNEVALRALRVSSGLLSIECAGRSEFLLGVHREENLVGKLVAVEVPMATNVEVQINALALLTVPHSYSSNIVRLQR